jgi:hypothetical protein
MKTYIECFEIRNSHLPIASKLMNNYSEVFFTSRIINIIVGESTSIVIVEITGSYPFIENKWKTIVVENEQIK